MKSSLAVVLLGWLLFVALLASVHFSTSPAPTAGETRTEHTTEQDRR